MTTAIDTNILLDLLIPEAPRGNEAVALLDLAATAGELTICEMVYAEVAAHFPDQVALQRFLSDTRIRFEPCGPASLADAGRAWRRHRQASPEGQCPQCGAHIDVRCNKCGPIRMRAHLIADFLVGAHAAHHADRLLSRDRGFYRRYFPRLVVIRGPEEWREA